MRRLVSRLALLTLAGAPTLAAQVTRTTPPDSVAPVQRGAAAAQQLPIDPASPAWVQENTAKNNAGTRRGDVWAKDPDAASIAANAKLPMPKLNPADRKQVEWLLRSIAHDSMEGRATASRGIERAAQFIAGQFRKVGLQPIGDEGYFQNVPTRFVPPDTAAPFPGGRGRGARPQVLASMAALDSVPANQRRLSRNVVGRIPGTDPLLKDEVVMVISHYDHLGKAGSEFGSCTAKGADSVCNGADDDGAGTVAVMEIARHLAKSNPKRTIVFGTMTGEESGLIGTNWYLNHPILPLEKTVAVFEIEMIGRPDSLAGGVGKTWLTGYYRSTMGDMLQKNGIAIVADARPTQSFFTRSDNIGFARRGIPSHTLSTFNLHPDYHTAADDVDKVDFDHMTMAISAAVEAVRHLANDTAKPSWYPGARPAAPAARGGRGGQ